MVPAMHDPGLRWPQPRREIAAPWATAVRWHLISPWFLRALLLAGCALAAAAVLWQSHPAAYLLADPALARLLQGMAVLKGVAVLVGVSAVAWRFGWYVTRPVAAAYLAGCWAMTGSTLSIWRLTAIPLAAVVFHVALVGVLLAAWRDDGKRR